MVSFWSSDDKLTFLPFMECFISRWVTWKHSTMSKSRNNILNTFWLIIHDCKHWHKYMPPRLPHSPLPTPTYASFQKDIPHFHLWGLVCVSGERYNDYKLLVSVGLTGRDVPFITVTGTRQGLWVRFMRAREETVMKNKCCGDLPAHNDKMFNPSR